METIHRNVSAVSTNKGGLLSHINVAKHRSDLLRPDKAQVYWAHYREGPHTWEFEKTEINKRLVKIIIKPPKTEWAPAKQSIQSSKNGTLHFPVDYPRLNAEAKWGSNPIPRMDEITDSPGKAVLFLTLDANSKY